MAEEEAEADAEKEAEREKDLVTEDEEEMQEAAEEEDEAVTVEGGLEIAVKTGAALNEDEGGAAVVMVSLAGESNKLRDEDSNDDGFGKDLA